MAEEEGKKEDFHWYNELEGNTSDEKLKLL